MKERLLAIQTREGWSDREMAERLGCSRPLWTLIRNGKNEMSADLLMKAAGAFPELSADLLDLARDAATPRTNTGRKAA